MSNNGSNGAELEALQATFADCGYVFRHFEDCRVACMRWQAGRDVADTVILPDGSGYIVEFFQLIAWAESAERLIDKLAGASGEITVS